MKKRKLSRPLTKDERQTVRDFFEENASFLHFIYSLFCSDRSSEADIIQECFLRIMINIDTFLLMTPQRRKAYVIPIIEHLCIDKIRREKRVSIVPLSEEVECDEVPPGSESHLSIMLLSRRLPERDWYLLKGLYIDGLSKEELAQSLNCSVDSLRMMASRARKAARIILEDAVKDESNNQNSI